MKIILSNSIRGHNGSSSEPNWKDIERLIKLLDLSEGSIGLDLTDDDNFLIRSLEIRGESKKHLLTYLVPIQDIQPGTEYEEEVFSLIDLPSTTGPDMVEICGDYWGAAMVGNDISVVLKAFKEFFETGKIDLKAYGISDNGSVRNSVSFL